MGLYPAGSATGARDRSGPPRHGSARFPRRGSGCARSGDARLHKAPRETGSAHPPAARTTPRTPGRSVRRASHPPYSRHSHHGAHREPACSWGKSPRRAPEDSPPVFNPSRKSCPHSPSRRGVAGQPAPQKGEAETSTRLRGRLSPPPASSRNRAHAASDASSSPSGPSVRRAISCGQFCRPRRRANNDPPFGKSSATVP